MREIVSTLLLSSLLLLSIVSANELSRCCSGGTRHFRQTSTCSNIRSEGSSMTCVRAASICCLRSLLDDSCDDGTETAREEESCTANINVLGGGLRKECCDCCLLAKELLHRNEPCVPPTGFSAACLKAFSKCCSSSVQISQPHLISTGGFSEDDGFANSGDRCSSAGCDHLCNDRGGDSVECTCRAGFKLAPDGTSCTDIDECKSRTPPCEWGRENCVNTIGGYICQPLNPEAVRILSADAQRRFVRMRNGRHQRPQDTRDVQLRDAPAKMATPACNDGYEYRDGKCRDVDECNLGAHDCGPLYQCRNTQGSYRCDPKKCGEGELQNPQTGECTSIDCPIGYFPKNAMCNDIDECADGDRCGPNEQCVNTPGSFRCQDMGNMCADGYYTNKNTGFCEDVDECMTGACGSLQCINLPGSYRCKCVAGYEFNDKNKRCEDVDECMKFGGHVCDPSAECQNTIGSFICKCKPGYKLASDERHCEDVNECITGEARCEQRCVNIPGSYQCICDRGFALGADGLTCEDIDECAIWAGSGSELCMGGCVNTRGSYLCQCPPGYKIQPDGRTCIDVDECALGECRGGDRICVNTLGQYKCHKIECPHNYVLDSKNKNSVDDGFSCLKSCDQDDASCIGNHTREILYQFRAVPTMKFVRNQVEVSRIRADMDIPFSVEYSLDRVGRRHFHIEQERNIGIVKLIRPIDGPMTETIRVNIHVKSRTGVLLAYNVAIIEVHVSRYSF